MGADRSLSFKNRSQEVQGLKFKNLAHFKTTGALAPGQKLQRSGSTVGGGSICPDSVPKCVGYFRPIAP